MQCLRHHHLEVKGELHGGVGVRVIDAQQWRVSREKVRMCAKLAVWCSGYMRLQE